MSNFILSFSIVTLAIIKSSLFIQIWQRTDNGKYDFSLDKSLIGLIFQSCDFSGTVQRQQFYLS
jgi:hypothetical protein